MSPKDKAAAVAAQPHLQQRTKPCINARIAVSVVLVVRGRGRKNGGGDLELLRDSGHGVYSAVLKNIRYATYTKYWDCKVENLGLMFMRPYMDPRQFTLQLLIWHVHGFFLFLVYAQLCSYGSSSFSIRKSVTTWRR